MAIDLSAINALPTINTATRLKLYQQAEASLLIAGQSYSVEERQKVNAQLSEIRQAIKDLQAELEDERGGGQDIVLMQFGQS